MPTHATAFSPVEWQARQELAACYRVFALLGWTELIYNHISLRVPAAAEGAADQTPAFLINPFGLHYTEVRASNLVKIDLQGRVLDGSPYKANAAGFAPHAAIHGGIPAAHCVMHTHTTAGMAVACAERGLTHDNFYAAQLGGRVAYHAFEGITVHADEGPRLLRNIGDKPAVILQNHGLLAWGATVPTAFFTMFTLQRACEVQLAGAALGATIPIPQDVQRRCATDAAKVSNGPDIGRDAFDALVRLVDRQDRSWRD